MEMFFDYTCPFAYQAHRWLDGIEPQVAAAWRPFSLLELNYRGDGPSVWELEERRDDISLLLFAGHGLVAAGDADIDGYRRAAFAAWHESDDRLDTSAVLGLAAGAGVPDPTAGDLRAHFHDAAAHHRAAERLGVFGSSTLVFGPDAVVFVKLASPPHGGGRATLLDQVRQLAQRPELLEIKRPAPVPDVSVREAAG